MTGAGPHPLRVLLFSPVRGLDPPGGDIAYTEALLADPPDGVEYVTYPEAIERGLVAVRGRRTRHGRMRAADVGILGLRAVESGLRRSGVMFREPYWYVSIEPGAFDLIHSHLFALRQVGPRIPVVSSDGYPLEVLYQNVDGWSRRRASLATRVEELCARTTGTHVPGLWAPSGDLMTVYTERFREWVVQRGRTRAPVEVIGNALEPLDPPDRFSDGRTLVFVGRDFRSKGGDIAAAAFDRLRREHSDLRLIVVTSASDTPRELSGVPGVELLLDAPRDEVLGGVLPRSDVLLLPTRSDCGAPYGLLEALRSGVPAVVSDHPWLDERLGLPAVERSDLSAEGFAAAAARLLGRDRDATARDARALWAESFSTSGFGRRLLDMYRRQLDPVPEGDPDLRILVVARPMDLRRVRENAFSGRHLGMIEAMRALGEVSILGLRHWHDDRTVAKELSDLPYDEVTVPRADDRRSRRIRRALAGLARRRPRAAWERDATARTARLAPDVIVCIGPWNIDTFRIFPDMAPTMIVYEEDLRRMPGLNPQSLRARALRAVEAVADRRAGLRPKTVAVISDPEIPGARRRFRGARIDVLPFTLPQEEWPIADGPSDGDYILAVANFAEDRNAEGLIDVIDALSRRIIGSPPQLKIVSALGLTPALDQRVGAHAWIEHLPPVESVYPLYREARLALVPATRATGFKTTILQAWTAGCAVVSTDGAVATLRPRGQASVAVGHDADEVADLLAELWIQAGRRLELAASGLSYARASRPDRGLWVRAVRDMFASPCERNRNAERSG